MQEKQLDARVGGTMGLGEQNNHPWRLGSTCRRASGPDVAPLPLSLGRSRAGQAKRGFTQTIQSWQGPGIR